jgi:FkbM family methyltransferase
MIRFGTSYGGFFYPSGLRLNPQSVIYCVGAGEDISHDVQLAKFSGAAVHIFDPTPRAITHVQYVKDLLDKKVEKIPSARYGGGDGKYLDQILSTEISGDKLILHPFGIGVENLADAPFYLPSNTEYVSCSLVPGMKGTKSISVEIKTLIDSMRMLGHDHIDLLKLDIEGSECDVLHQMLDAGIYPTYLGIDFDLGYTGEKVRDLEKVNATIQRLKSVGYSLIHERGPDKSFVRI